MKLDLHCHVKEGSPDSKVTIEEYINILKSKGFDGMLVTDHDSYKGYRYYKDHLQGKIKDFIVLKGIEYDTSDAGHFIVVLPSYVNLPILEHKGLKISKLTNIVHSYGGILGPAHPCGEPFLSAFSFGKCKKHPSVAKHFDFIEGFNSGEERFANAKACAIADKYNKPVTAGSDAHWHDCCGLSYTELDEFVHNENEFIDYIKKGKPTSTHWEKYYGTLKVRLGRLNKILVYGFYPYNKAGALVHLRKRQAELKKIKWDLIDSYNHHKEIIEGIEKKLNDRYAEFADYIDDIIKNDKYRGMLEHRHHGNVSTLEHSEHVAATSQKLAKLLHIKNLDTKALLKGALLHDFYLYDWHKGENGEHRWHGYHHADKAISNAKEEFNLSKKEQSIIHSHMWPLNITRVPKCREAWLVCMADKYVSLVESLFSRKL